MNRQEFEQMEPGKLLDKIQELNKKLFNVNQQSPVFNQLRGIIQEAQMVYSEQLAVDRYNMQNEERDSVINIGEIESEVYTPHYGEGNPILDVVVSSYLQEPKK
jgi:hypothetical protein